MPRTYHLHSVQKIPISLEAAWEFFSRPQNLQDITPQHLDFNIISKHHGEKMYAGQLIEYRLRPLFGIPVYWMTEITHVSPMQYFVDEQRFGPYQLWHHQHHFEAISGGVLMTDIVHYRLPLGFIGSAAHGLFLKKNISGIFDHRYAAIGARFGSL